jgi:amino acid transporter
VLTSTRMPFAMAEDGYLPSILTARHRRFGTPWIAIVVSGAVYALLSLHSLTQLIVIYSWLRAATTVITVVAAWQLRRTRPDLPRSFVVPGGTPGLLAAVAAVVMMTVVALVGSDPYGLRWGPVALAAGPLIYWLLRGRIRHV